MLTPSPSLYSLHEGKSRFLSVFAPFCDCFRGFCGRLECASPESQSSNRLLYSLHTCNEESPSGRGLGLASLMSQNTVDILPVIFGGVFFRLAWRIGDFLLTGPNIGESG